MSPPVSNSAYGSERDIQYASHGETAENHGAANEVANDNDSDEGTATLSVGPGKTPIKELHWNNEKNSWYPIYPRDTALRPCEECPQYGSIPSALVSHYTRIAASN
jgi:hypothetical protein